MKTTGWKREVFAQYARGYQPQKMHETEDRAEAFRWARFYAARPAVWVGAWVFEPGGARVEA